MKRTLLLGALVLLVMLIALSALKRPQPSNLTAQPEDEIGVELVSPNLLEPTPTTPDFGRGGSSYADPGGLFSVLYPNEYVFDDSDPKHARIYYRAETNRAQGEITDGVLVVFEAVPLQGKSLEEAVDARISDATADGSTEVTQPKRATLVNGYPGFSYEIGGFGAATTIVLRKDTQAETALAITYVVADPENRGYQRQVDAMLQTLQLFK